MRSITEVARNIAIVVAVTLCSCAGSQTPIGVSPTKRPTMMSVTLAGGGSVHTSTLVGKPVVLFLFATFDAVCQAAAQPLGFFAKRRSDVAVLGLAVQPDARQLVKAWVHALSPPFDVGYDASHRLENGTSVLGHIDAVPTYVVLDRRGYEVKRVQGYQTEQALDALIASID